MTGPEYLATIARLGITGPKAAVLFGYTRQIHYSTWSKDGPPLAVAAWLRYMDQSGFTPAQFQALAQCSEPRADDCG